MAAPKIPLMTRAFAALKSVDVEFTRDEHGGLYMAAPGFPQSDLYRVSLGSAEAVLLLRQIWGAWHTPEGMERVAVGFSNHGLADVLGEARARAALASKLRHHRRVAALPDRVILDIGAGWDAIELTGQGRRRLLRPPADCPFLRAPTQRPYPTPKRVGAEERAAAIAKLQSFWPGIRGDRFITMLAALAWNLSTPRHYIGVLLSGPEGVGKSTFAEVIRTLVDPSIKPLTPMPDRDVMRHLMTIGSHSHMLAVDNISTMDRSVADMLCQRLDGGAGQYKANYTDSDLATVPSVGPVLLTAIAAMLEFADLADRLLPLDLNEADMSAMARLAEPELRAQLAELMPVLFGALLDAASAGLAGAERFEPVPGVRGGQFTRFAQAAARVLGESPAAMAAMLAELADDRRRMVARAAPVSAALADFVTARRRGRDADGGMLADPLGPIWTGTATELLGELGRANPMARADSAFPHNGARLETELARLRLALEAAGIRTVARRKNGVGHPLSPAGGQARWLELWDHEPGELAPDRDGDTNKGSVGGAGVAVEGASGRDPAQTRH